MSEKEKKKIHLNNVGFQWGDQKNEKVSEKIEDTSLEKKEEVSLTQRIKDINSSAHEDVLNNSDVTKFRSEEQEELNNVVKSLGSGIEHHEKTARDNTKSELSQALTFLSESQNKTESVQNDSTKPQIHKSEVKEDIPSFIKDASKKNTRKEVKKENSPPWINYGIPFLLIAALLALGVVWNAKKTKNEQANAVAVATINNIENILPVENNQKVNMDSSLLLVNNENIVKAAAPIANLDFTNEKNTLITKKDGSVIINDDLKITNINPKEEVALGSIVAVPGQTDIPTVQFVAATQTPISVKESLSINSVIPVQGANSLSVISLAQWPNAINLREMSKDFNEIESLFPKTLYQKQETFDGKDLLTIYDKRSVAQERFVKQNQSCYFIPNEMGGNWMGVNYFLMSYCFLNNQFIGVNMYTNAEPDVMKKVEANIKKYPYYHISSVYKGNGYNLISIEQSNAYKILEEYRIAILNNAIVKK